MGVAGKVTAVSASVFLAFLGVPLIHVETAGAEELATPSPAIESLDAVGTDSNADENPANAPAAATATATEPAAVPLANAAAADPVAEVVTADGTTTSYATLQEAASAAPAGSTINLLSDYDAPAFTQNGLHVSLWLDKSITLNGNGHTLTVHNYGVALMGGDTEASAANFTIKNIAITNSEDYGRVLYTYKGHKTVRIEGATLTTTGAGNTQVVTIGSDVPETTDAAIVGSTIQASEAGYGIIVFNPVNMTIADSDISGYAALYLKGPSNSAGSSNSTIDIKDGSVLKSTGIPGPGNAFGTIVVERCQNVKIDVTDSTVQAQSNDGTGDDAAPQSVVLFNYYDAGEPDSVAKDNTVTFGEGSKVDALGTNSSLTSSSGLPNTVNATQGTYNLEGNVFQVPGAVSPTKLAVTGGHWNKDVSQYVPEGYETVNSGEDPSAPYTVAPKSTQPTNPDKPDTPGADEPTNPDEPAHHAEGDNPGGDQGQTDDKATDNNASDKASSEGADTDASASANHSGGNNYSAYRSGTGSNYHASTGSGRSFPKTADDNLPATLATAVTALAAASVAALANRKMRREE